jgi:8-oxo-dGTP diphosphatase
MKTYEFPRAALTVDCVVFGVDDAGLQVLLVKRGVAPFRGAWALPGGFVRVDERVEDAARRELREETAVERAHLEPVGVFDALDRDPRERVISIAYYALVRLLDHRVRAATDAADAAWFAAHDLPKLAFDHANIVEAARRTLSTRVRSAPIGFELLPPKFKLTQLQHLYEAILERPLDKRNFRKKVLALDLLEELDEIEVSVAHRAARLYRFDEKKYRTLSKRGFHFSL